MTSGKWQMMRVSRASQPVPSAILDQNVLFWGERGILCTVRYLAASLVSTRWFPVAPPPSRDKQTRLLTLPTVHSPLLCGATWAQNEIILSQKSPRCVRNTDPVSGEDALHSRDELFGGQLNSCARQTGSSLTAVCHVPFPWCLAQDLRHQSSGGTWQCVRKTEKLPGVPETHPCLWQLRKPRAGHTAAGAGFENGPGGAAAPAGVSTAPPGSSNARV